MKVEREGDSSSIAELCSHPRDSAWFCLRTRLKHEHIAAAHLRCIPGVAVFNPQLRLVRSTRRGPRSSTESLFPNYIFARFILESLLEKVSYTPGVKLVLRFGDRIPEIPDAVIDALREELAELGSETITDIPAAGDQLEITQGPFAGTTAVVTQVIPGQHRARVLIDVMGRSVPAELSLGLMLVNRRNAAQIALKRAAETMVTQTPMVPAHLAQAPFALKEAGERITRLC